MIPRPELAEPRIVDAPRPDLRAVPGQFFLAVPPTFDPFLPRVVFPFRLRGESVESLILPPEVAGWTMHGNALELRGAYGRGFALPAQGGRALILAQDALAGAQLLSVVLTLVAREVEVAVVCGPNERMERWLPPEVEYHTAEDVLSAAGDLWNWADRVYACGQMAFYDRLLHAATQARLKLEAGWAQLLLRELPMPCGVGICYLCALKTTRGIVLNCQSGPVLDLADWIAEA